ncbi:MAG: hypothetical protein J0626_08670, partial [Rhodospirillaceae bacterium]|nr:hypothetical protein [Rhodospirillaceae bacterium]
MRMTLLVPCPGRDGQDMAWTGYRFQSLGIAHILPTCSGGSAARLPDAAGGNLTGHGQTLVFLGGSRGVDR